MVRKAAFNLAPQGGGGSEGPIRKIFSGVLDELENSRSHTGEKYASKIGGTF